MLFFSLFAGVLVDKIEKKKIIIFTQIVLALCALAISILVLTKQVQYWHLLVIALIIGFANTIDMPGRLTFIIEMIGKEDLMNAIALNSTIFNLARIIGPSIAGIVMQAVGIGFCFLINAISFIPVITGLFFIKPLFCISNKSNNKILKDIGEGLKYIYSQRILFWTLAAVFVIGTFGMNFNVLVPVYAKTVLNLGEAGFGFLMACMGVGSLFGALTIATRSRKGPKSIILVSSIIITAVTFILIGINRYFLQAGLFLALAGYSNVVFFTTANSTLQLNAKDHFRGRVMSVYTLLFGGTTPFGNLFAGGVCNFYGAKFGFLACSAAIILFSLLLYVYSKNMKKVQI